VNRTEGPGVLEVRTRRRADNPRTQEKIMSSRKFALAATLLLAGAVTAGSAHAGPNVQVQVGIETPMLRLPGHVMLPLPPIPVPRIVVAAPPHAAHRGGRTAARRTSAP
jgi:hypothetical protein